uniref:Uncharacterized protein n=1 Tax=Physcomitrium patens TaxID=3218 RepID=A0A7I4CCY2_PHYPA
MKISEAASDLLVVLPESSKKYQPGLRPAVNMIVT